MKKRYIFLIILVFVLSACTAEDLKQPSENKVWARMAINSSPSTIKYWEDQIEKKKKLGNKSEEEILKLKNKIRDENIWIKDMQAILDDKKPSGEGIELHRKMQQKILKRATVDTPSYCNIKNVLRIYDRLESGEPLGEYSCG